MMKQSNSVLKGICNRVKMSSLTYFPYISI